MCGFVGFLGNKFLKNNDFAKSTLISMAKSLNHRGPDAHGYWIDVDYSLFLAHRRLSIVDLSKAGNQPMVSHSQRYVLAYNGEIYNHIELRGLIEKKAKFNLRWQGKSDTETLLALIDFFGLEKALHMLEGMYSFALWDRKFHELFLVRDPMGEKPLYYGSQKGSIYVRFGVKVT